MQVTVIARDTIGAVVEWVDDGKLCRGIIPIKALRGDGEVYKTELRRAVPYGVPWEEVVDLKATSEMLAENLRRRGIWRFEDLQLNPEVAFAALQATYGVDYHTLLKLAKAEK